MSVNGSTSAAVASASYTPPFHATTSYQESAHVTGSLTSALASNPTVDASLDGGPYATAYLEAHMTSSPSYRYVYLLWFILAGLALLYAVAHHLRLSGGYFGAWYSKWGIKRKVFGKASHGRRGTVLPSNNVMVSIAVLAIISAVLAVVGPDYISPSSSAFNFSKRSYVAYSISKAFWTSGNRFGDMAFALTPLVVLLALKAPPFAVLSLRSLTHLFNDKLALFHRAAAWVVWFMATVHTVLWTIQLFSDQHNGQAVWFTIWNSYHFIFGCIAYGLMSAVMVLSLKPVRKRAYEFFYAAHVVLVLGTIVCSAIHHPALWWWMAAALAIWCCERVVRLLRMAKINGLFGQSKKYSVIGGKPYDDQTYPLQDFKTGPNRQPYINPYTDETHPHPSEMTRSHSGAVSMSGSSTGESEFGRQSESKHYGERPLSIVSAYDSHAPPPLLQARSQSIAHTLNFPAYTPAAIPVGHAQAQLLPSRTIRLTIKVARPFHWAPGQSVLLYLPELSWWQSHPFTIVNNDPTEIVLLVKARKGLTRKLFDLVRKRSLAAAGINSVRDQRISLTSMRTGSQHIQMPPIFLKAYVDGPMGSSERVRWKEHSSAVIVCGGSGVSFGAAICEYVCRSIQNRVGKTQRVRFCWVVREYAEIAWVAGQLRYCQDMVSADQLQIDIFVTNGQKIRDEFAPPKPVFARDAQSRSNSFDSAASEMSMDMATDTDEAVDEVLAASYADIIDLTNYEDEEDVDDPAETRLSSKIGEQGKIRRARSRRSVKGRSVPSRVKSPSRPLSRLPSHPDLQDGAPGTLGGGHSPHGSRNDPLLGYPHSALSPLGSQPLPLPSSWVASADNRQSIHSLADSTYNAYDPFTPGFSRGHASGPSYSPSVAYSTGMDDNMSSAGDSFRELSIRDILSRTSRTQSMVLLENTGGGDPQGDAGLWIDEADNAAMTVMSEMARAGKPKLSAVLEEEIELAQGSMIVATCGPVTLNTVVRNLVSKHISPSRIRKGDKRGHIVVYSEDYEG